MLCFAAQQVGSGQQMSSVTFCSVSLPKTSRRLAAAHACAQHDLSRLLESGAEWGQVSKDVGTKMMDNLYDILSRESFDIDRKAFCYTHRRLCRVHGLSLVSLLQQRGLLWFVYACILASNWQPVPLGCP